MPEDENKNGGTPVNVKFNPHLHEEGVVERNMLNKKVQEENPFEQSEENKEYFDKLRNKKKNVVAPDTFAAGNLTGITGANQRSVLAPEGHYANLHEEVGLDLFANQESWDKLGYSEQGLIDMGMNTLGGFLTNATSQFLDNISANDPRALYNTAMGNTEEKYSNIIHEWAKDLREWGDAEFHLYDDGGTSPLDGVYWARQFQQLGTSVGMIAESFVEMALLKKLPLGAGSKLAKLRGIATSPMAFGSFQGLKETYINALETGDGTYNKYREMGYSEEEARKKGNEAATLGFRMEALPMMLMNGLQFASIGKYNPFMKKQPNLGFSGGFETMSEHAFKNINSKFGKKLVDYGTNMIAESIEEGIQTGVGKYAQYEIGLADGLVNEQSIDDILFDDTEMRDSMIGGALGGSVFRFMGKRLNTLTQNLTKGESMKQQQANYDNYLAGISKRVGQETLELTKALEEGDERKTDMIRKRMQRNNALEVLQFDLMNQTEKGFDTYVSSLAEMKEAVNSGDTDKMKNYGITEPQDVEMVLKNIDTYISDANNLRDKLVNTLEKTDDVHAAMKIVDAEQTTDDLIDLQERSNDKIQEFKSNDKAYQSLTEVGKQEFDLIAEKRAIVAKAQHNSITKEQKNRIDEINSELGTLREENKKYKGKANDKRVLKTLNGETLIKEQINQMEIEDYQEKLAEKLVYWNDKKNQRKEKITRAEKRINKAKKAEALKQAKEDLKQEEALPTNIEEKINSKIEKAEVKEIVNKGKVDVPLNKVAQTQDTTKSTLTAEQKAELKASSEAFGGFTVDDISESDARKHKSNEIVEDLGIKGSDSSVIINNDDLFAPAALGGFTEAQLNKLKDHVGDYVSSLTEDLGREPSFEDFIRDFIKNNTKEATDRIFNALIEGWKANGFKAANYDQVYNDIFKDRKEMSSDILNLADEMIEIEGKPKVEAKNDVILNKVTEAKSPVVKLDNNNRPAVKDDNSFRTSVPTLKAAHLSIPYESELVEIDGEQVLITKDTSEDLNVGTDIKSQKLLNPDKYAAGTKLTVQVADNYKDMKVSTWLDDYTKGPSMTFGEWMTSNNIEEGSQEWIEKVPMTAIDEDGDAVFFVHSTDWYNGINVGLKDDINAQAEVIEAARENLRDIRGKVLSNNAVEIEITEKRPGTFKKINSDQPAITLSQANPHTQIAVANNQGELIVDGKVFETDGKTLINEELFERGHTYDVRQTGKGEYIALKVLRENVSPQAVTSMSKVAEAYLMQFDKHGIASNPEQNKQVRDDILSMTGTDIYSREGIEEYLNQFAITVSGKFGSVQDIPAAVEANSKISVGTPYMSIQKGTLVFGVKGKAFSGSNQVLYVNPHKVNDKGGPAVMKSVIDQFNKMLPSITQNVNQKALGKKSKMAFVSEDGVVTPQGTYTDFIKDSLKTNVKSFNVGTKDAPVYATIVQPVINFKVSDETTKVEKIEEVATKVTESQVLTKEESTIAQESAKEVQATSKEILEAKNVNEIETLRNTIDVLKQLGTPANDPSFLFAVEELERLTGEQGDFAPIALSDEIVNQMREESDTIDGVSILQESQLVSYIFNEISTKVDFKERQGVAKKELLQEIKDSYFNLIEPKNLIATATVENLKKLNAVNPNKRMTALIAKMEEDIKVFNHIKNNWSTFEKKAFEKIEKFTGIKEAKMETAEIEDASTQQEKNHSKTSLEDNGKESASYELKRFLNGIKEVDAAGKTKNGFLGVNTYVGFDKAYETITSLLASPYEVDSDYDQFILRLKDNVEVYPWLSQVIEELDTADQQIKNELVYELTKHSLSMKFVAFSKNRDNKYTLKVYDTNAHEINRVIKQQWNSNFKQGTLVFVEDGVHKINKAKAQELLTKFNGWESAFKADPGTRKKKSAVQIPTSEVKDWLDDFGINLTNETIEELKARPLTVNTKEGKKKMAFNQMFAKSSNTEGIFGLLGNYLEQIITREDTSFEENPANHPFEDAGNALQLLATVEAKHSAYATTNSFRDGEKGIYGYTPTKFATDTTKKLKFSQDFRNELLDKSFNKHSYMLNMLNNDESFAEKFRIDHLGITAMKELGKKAFGNNDITSLTESDHEITKLGLFQDTRQGEVNGTLGKDDFVGLRMARMFMPTMSDKSQMLMMHTAVLDLKEKHFQIDSKNNVEMRAELIDILNQQLITPELERMHNFASTIKQTNIKGYDMAAKMFLMIPELNNIVDKETGKRAISLIGNAPGQYTADWFQTKFNKEIKKVLNNLITTEVNEKMAEWEEAGYFESTDKGEVLGLKLIDNTYLNKKSAPSTPTLTKLKLAANDFVINSLISNANTNMMFTGDIAVYSQDKIRKYFQDGDVHLPKDKYGNKAYAAAVKDIISTNMGKRLGLMLTPGNKLANSANSEYLQLFLDDHVDITSNVKFLVDLYYGEEDVKYAEKRVKDYNKSKDLVTRQTIAKELSERFPEISDYFDIESTDAQEYTTANEHIDVLYGQGRLSSKEYNTIKEKITTQLEAETKGTKIPESAMLNYNELSVVLQPIKPVHTGFKSDTEGFDVMRMMYIKTSSFPLLPQVTKGTELDKLRKMMENLEASKGKNVRVSYQSGNKVGAVKNAVSPFNPDGTFNENLTLDKLVDSSLTLSRDNFRIQQNVPFKSAKRKEDVVSLGTQTLKLLFGDGMMDLDGFQYNEETLNGRELQQRFNENFENYVSHKKASLYKKLGVDKNGQPIDIDKTMKGLQDLLQKEAKERGYPKQDIEALTLTPKLDSQGNVIDVEFSTPLWLSPNSNRYEALLNAIVTNKLINLKIPGNSFVAGSEAGFKMASDLSGVNQSRVIYTSAYEGEMKAAEFHEDGSLKRAQIMVPSKFRNNEGELIKFIDEKGNPNPTYTERGEDGVLRLKADMIAEELLNVTSFRIPTSGHVSMSQLEIVGILPIEVGDLMIVPRNLTKQKGLDFDVDKETTYQLHTFIDDEGKVKTLEEEDRLKVLKAADTMVGKDWLTNQTPEAKLLRAIFGNDPDFTLDDFNEIEEGSKLERVNDQFDQKLMENNFVKAHSSVLNNSNPEVQQKINKVLSMDFAQSQAEMVQEINEKNTDNTYFSILSDRFQKDKMFLGASGKLGIGVYSNYVVFHSLTQQVAEPIQLMDENEEGEKVPLKLNIGRQTSNGILGLAESLAPNNLKRSIAEVFAERQNTATDNEKEQIMGRLNVNEVTINVDSLLTALGFDKDVLDDGTEVSIPYLLMSQPIMKEFVKEERKTKANTTEFDAAATMKVINRLIAKYTNMTEAEIDPDQWEEWTSQLTGQNLYNNLTTPSPIIQIAAFSTFLKMKGYAESLAGVQKRLNINNEGLGKSFFDVLDKYEGIQNLPNGTFKNVDSLIGSFVPTNNLMAAEIRELEEEGYVRIGRNMIKPETPVGSMVIHGVSAGADLWSRYFPYNNPEIKGAMKEIMDNISNEDTSDNKKIKIRQDIFKDLKKYLVSSNKLGIFEGNPQQRRSELFMDTVNNQSLANYLQDVMYSGDETSDLLKTNKLLSRFQFDINKNGLPSTIRFNNAKGESFDEDYLYMALIELLEDNRVLPNKNGETYTTRQLAQDLIAYNYLEGGVQEAIQFSKYVPVSYLNAVGFSDSTRKWSSRYSADIFKDILGVKDKDNSRFTKQYIQHNPSRLAKIDPTKNIMDAKYGKGSKLSELHSFKINEDSLTQSQIFEMANSSFIAIYNKDAKKGTSKFQIYEAVGGEAVRVPSLGTFGMSEYSIKEDNVQSLVNPNHKANTPSKKINTTKSSNADVFGLQDSTVPEIVENIANYDFKENSHLKAVINAIKPHVTSDLTLSIADIVNEHGDRVAKGRHLNGHVTIDNHYFNSASHEDLAKTVIHELIHGLTVDYISQFVDKQGNYTVDNPPKEIVSLVRLFNETKRKLGPEVQAYLEKRDKQLTGKTREGSTEREITVAYAGTNVREFVTLVMTEPNFQKEMKDVEFMQSEMTLWQKFASVINDMLFKIFGPDYAANGVTAKGIENALDIIEKQTEMKAETKRAEMEASDRLAEDLLNEPFGNIVDDTFDEMNIEDDLDNSDDSATFDNPFKCK